MGRVGSKPIIAILDRTNKPFCIKVLVIPSPVSFSIKADIDPLTSQPIWTGNVLNRSAWLVRKCIYKAVIDQNYRTWCYSVSHRVSILLSMAGVRNHTIDFLKCICIIGVVLHHCSNRRLLPEVREIFASAAYLTDWCVITFIGLSGFLEGSRLVASNDWKAYVTRDCSGLLP